jgi:hypothetical protein
MDDSQRETRALLDAVTKANDELAAMGVGGELVVIILPAHTRTWEDWTPDPGDKIGVVVGLDGKELYAGIGVDARSAAEAAVDWVAMRGR